MSVAGSLILLVGLASLAGCRGDDDGLGRGDNRSSSAIAGDADLAEVLRHPEPLARIAWIASHLERASRDQLDSIRNDFEEAALDRGDVEYTLLGVWWADFDPESAFSWAQANLRSRHPRVISAVVRAWARRDPQAALSSGLFYEIAPGAPIYRIDLLDALVVGWFESGQPGLETFLESLDDVSDRTQGLRTYARCRVLRDGAFETILWARNEASFGAEHRRLLLAGALSVIAGQEPELAAHWLPIIEADGVDVRSFVPRIARSWADHDHEAAMAWLGTLPPSSDRNAGLTRVAGVWSRIDGSSLSQWISTHAGEAWLDPVRVQSIRRSVNISGNEADWATAMRRAESIVDADRRAVTILWVAKRWITFDELAARGWIDANRGLLSEDQWKRVATVPAAPGGGRGVVSQGSRAS